MQVNFWFELYVASVAWLLVMSLTVIFLYSLGTALDVSCDRNLRWSTTYCLVDDEPALFLWFAGITLWPLAICLMLASKFHLWLFGR